MVFNKCFSSNGLDYSKTSGPVLRISSVVYYPKAIAFLNNAGETRFYSLTTFLQSP